MAQGAATPLEVWQSSYGDENRIALEAEALLTQLDASGALAYEPVFDASGKSVETLMREQDRFVGAFFPATVDQMLCRVNPDACTVTEDGATAWTNTSNDTLNLPKVTFHPVVTFGIIEKPAGTTVDEIWSPEIDCTSYGFTCTDAVRALNQANPVAYDPKVAGFVTVPQLAYQAEITPKTLTPLATERWIEGRPLVKIDNFLAKGPGGASFASFSGEPAFGLQKDLFDRIDFPFSGVTDPDQVDERFKGKVVIGVADTWFDAGHCEFGGRVMVMNPPTGRHGPGTPGGACGVEAPSDLVSKTWDHATHVVGIIAAGLDGQGVAGLNPFAQLDFQLINLDDFRFVLKRNAIAMTLVADVTNHGVDVFNFSWGYVNDSAGFDQIAGQLTGALATRTLVVVAAGNESIQFKWGACAVLPACLTESPNVITVVGLDRDPDHPSLWQKSGSAGSNSSAAFHIGAIASEVVSTVSGNRFGALSGTSQAAPQVAATAAYIISAYKAMKGGDAVLPVKVKNRLIATSDIFGSLLKSVLGGRLNMARAMDIGFDQLVLRSDPTKVLRGQLIQLGNNPDDQHILCTSIASGDRSRVVADDLERMVRIPNSNNFIVFAAQRAEEALGAIRRIGPCELNTITHRASFLVDGANDPIEFKISDIMDFTASME